MAIIAAIRMDLDGRIAAILRKKGIKGVGPQATFRELGLDSLDAMSLIMELEGELKVTIPDDRLVSIKTAGELKAVFEELLRAKGG